MEKYNAERWAAVWGNKNQINGTTDVQYRMNKTSIVELFCEPHSSIHSICSSIWMKEKKKQDSNGNWDKKILFRFKTKLNLVDEIFSPGFFLFQWHVQQPTWACYLNWLKFEESHKQYTSMRTFLYVFFIFDWSSLLRLFEISRKSPF